MSVIEIASGDLTRDPSDAIVNAANSSLLGGGGVDGAIHAAGGPQILAACRELRRTSLPDGLATGCAVATTGGDLAARWVIHAVGPQHWEHPDGGPDLLASAHVASLDEALRVGASTVAFPAISCGAYGWSADAAAPIALAAVRSWLDANPGVMRVRFVMFNDAALEAFTRAQAASPPK